MRFSVFYWIKGIVIISCFSVIVAQSVNDNNTPAIKKRMDSEGCLVIDTMNQCRDEMIQFTLYNRWLPRSGFNISGAEYLRKIFRPGDRLKVIVHGLIIDHMTPQLYEIKDGE